MFLLVQWYSFCILLAVIGIAIVVLVRRRLARSLLQSPRARGLFRFSDGVNFHTVDPIEILNAMEAHPEYRFDLHPGRVRDGEKEAIEITVDAVRTAFKVPAFTKVGTPGLTTQECLRLIGTFNCYCASQKKSTESKRI